MTMSFQLSGKMFFMLKITELHSDKLCVCVCAGGGGGGGGMCVCVCVCWTWRKAVWLMLGV